MKLPQPSARAMRSPDAFARWMGGTGLVGALGALFLCISHHGLGLV